jgi:hypothetical protein
MVKRVTAYLLIIVISAGILIAIHQAIFILASEDPK